MSINLLLYLKKVRSLISICKAEKSIYKSFKLKNEKVISFFNEKFVTSNRQALPRIYFPNGAIYIFYIKDFLKNKKIPIKNSLPFFMSKKDSIDIDDKYDLEYANLLLGKK